MRYRKEFDVALDGDRESMSSASEQADGGVHSVLPSWRGISRADILDFVARVVDATGPDFVPPRERIVVVDNDGTLWCEKPMPIQLDFTIRRLAALAGEDPVLRNMQPWKAALEHDTAWLAGAMSKHESGDDGDLRLLMEAIPRAFDGFTVEDYAGTVIEFFRDARNPRLDRPYRTCGYAPMAELLRYLEAHDFAVYIASGGDRDFMRPAAASMIGIPPERVIGSALGMTYQPGARPGDRTTVLYKASMDFFDDGSEKPIRIWSRIGRRPVVAVGNSDGDLPMLEFPDPDRPALRLLLRHDDDGREFSYTHGAETALRRAEEQRWTIVSMRDDWTTVFVDDERR